MHEQDSRRAGFHPVGYPEHGGSARVDGIVVVASVLRRALPLLRDDAGHQRDQLDAFKGGVIRGRGIRVDDERWVYGTPVLADPHVVIMHGSLADIGGVGRADVGQVGRLFGVSARGEDSSEQQDDNGA